MTTSQNTVSTLAGSAWRRKTLILALLGVLLSVGLSGQSVMPTPRQQFLDNNGNPCAGCLLYSFAAGTNTPATTYADATLATPNANPLVLDSAGRATVFLDTRITFKFTLATAADVPIWTVDSVDAVPSALNVEVSGVAGETLAQRQSVYLSSGLDATVAGRWYLTDADVVSKSSGATLVGVVMSPAIVALASGTIRIQGRVSGFSGLSEGLTYFVSATAGALTTVAPANAKVVGIAESPTTLLLTPSAASSGGVGAFSSLQVTSTAANAIDVAGGIEAGSGNVQVVNAAGNVLETAIADGTLLARNAANETITGAWTFSPSRTIAAAVQFTGLPGGASAGTIGLNANKLTFLGGSAGFAYLNAGGGPLTDVDASGHWSFLTSVAGLSRHTVRNTSFSSAAATILDIGNDTSSTAGELVATSSIFTPSGLFGTNTTVLAGNTAGGLTLGTTLSTSVRLSTNNTERITIGGSGNVLVAAPVHYTNVSSVSVSADTNDWNPTGLSTANVIRVDASGGDQSHAITGLSQQTSGREVTICIVSGSPSELNFQFENAGSLAANRFNFATTLTLTDQQCVQLWRDGVSDRWRKLR